MKILISVFFLIIGTLLVTASVSFALPTCPGSPSRDVEDYLSWSNCNGTFSKGLITISVEMKNGRAEGFGTWSNARGDKYLGMWRNNVMHGTGIMRYHDGSVDEGIWKNGEFKSAKKTSYSKRAEKTSELKSAFILLSPEKRKNIQIVHLTMMMILAMREPMLKVSGLVDYHLMLSRPISVHNLP